MKTPNKIYISQGLSKEAVKALSLHLNDKDICYIRKEAILEWAKAKHMELDPPQNERDFGRIEAVEELIKHIESL